MAVPEIELRVAALDVAQLKRQIKAVAEPSRP